MMNLLKTVNLQKPVLVRAGRLFAASGTRCVGLSMLFLLFHTGVRSQAGSDPSILWEAKFESSSCPGLHTIEGFDTQGTRGGCGSESKANTTAANGSTIEIVDNAGEGVPSFQGGSSVRFKFNRRDYVESTKHLQLRAWPDHLGGRDPSRDDLAPVCGKQGCGERWYSLSIYVPEDWVWDDASLIVNQLHETPDRSCGESFRSPPFAISIVDQQWNVTSWWTDNACDNGGGHPDTHRRNDLDYLTDQSIQRGQWTTFVMNMRWDYRKNSNGGRGFMKIWKNGELLIDHTGPNFYNDNTAGRWMFGMYSHKPASQCPPQTTCWNEGIAQKMLYFDNWVVGDESIDSYEEFATLAGLDGNSNPEPTPVSGISVGGCPSEAVGIGSSVSLQANVEPSEAGNQAVAWTSSNPSVASVNSEGVVTTLSEGQTTITATTAQGSFTDQCSLSVSASVCSETNLALSGSIHSVSSEQSGNPASNLIDGVADDDANRWSAQSFPQWVILDLGSVQSIGATRLQGYQDRAYQYQVYASSSLSAVESNDPSALVADASSNAAGGLVEQRFAATQARYVKVEVVGASNYDGDWVSAREVAVLSSCEEGPSDPGTDSGTISIRAQGDCGSEVMELRVDGAKVDEWTVSTTMSDYVYAGFTGGQVSVHLVNDQLEPCDRNLTVDYITVCGTTYQTEQVATETATCCTNNPEKLFTNGNFDFGDVGCTDDALSGEQTSRVLGGEAVRFSQESIVYPNPVWMNGTLRLKNIDKEATQAVIYNRQGKALRTSELKGNEHQIETMGLPQGTYYLRIDTPRGSQACKFIIR